MGGDQIVMATKDSLQTIPTYTDALHIYSTMEGTVPYPVMEVPIGPPAGPAWSLVPCMAPQPVSGIPRTHRLPA